MTRITLSLVLPLTIASLMAGCASAPSADSPQTESAPSDCSRLGAEIARTEEAKRAATEKERPQADALRRPPPEGVESLGSGPSLTQEQGAWKAVIPFAVAARYASGKAAVGEANKRLGELRAQSTRRGCTHGA